MRRKKLTLLVSEGKPYGVNENNIAVVLPDDFRKTVIKCLQNGDLKDGDIFEVDVDKEDNLIRRNFDQTVAIHRLFEKKYCRDEIITLLNTAIKKVKNKEDFEVEDLINCINN